MAYSQLTMLFSLIVTMVRVVAVNAVARTQSEAVSLDGLEWSKEMVPQRLRADLSSLHSLSLYLALGLLL